MKVRSALFVFVLLVGGAFAQVRVKAQEPPSPGPEPAVVAPVAAPAVDEEVKAKIEQLLELLDTKKTLNTVVDELLRQFRTAYPKVPEMLWARVKEEVLSKTFIDMLITIYAAHFTRQDIEELIDFWSSPVGRKFIREQPRILQESLAVSREYMKGANERILADVRKWEAEQEVQGGGLKAK